MMEDVSMERRKRRSFTEEFKAEAVRLMREGSWSAPRRVIPSRVVESSAYSTILTGNTASR